MRNERGTPLAFALIAPALAAVGCIKVAALNWGKNELFHHPTEDDLPNNVMIK